MDSLILFPTKQIRAKVTEAGRVVIPAELRSELGIEEGQDIVFTRDGRGIRITTLRDAISEVQDYFAGIAPTDQILSDELIRDRMTEATGEDRE